MRYTKDIYITGILGILTFILFFLGGNLEFIYKQLDQKYDWVFWIGTVISLAFGLLTIRNWFGSEAKKEMNHIFLFLVNIITSGMIILNGISMLIIITFGFPPQD